MLENPNKSSDVEMASFKWKTPKKDKLRIMPVSDSPWAPTGFGTNTKIYQLSLLRKDTILVTEDVKTPDTKHIIYRGLWDKMKPMKQ